jgi:hypothetical protein
MLRFVFSPALIAMILSSGVVGFAQVPAPASWPACDEFISKSPCIVQYDMSQIKRDKGATRQAPTHSDVQTKVGGRAAVRLIKASPFLACTVQGTPATPARDLSASVTGALTTLGSAGAVAVAFDAQVRVNRAMDLAALQAEFKTALESWKYSFEDTDEDTGKIPAEEAVKKLKSDLKAALQDENALENDARAGTNPFVIRDQLDDLRKVRDAIRQYLDFVNNIDLTQPKNLNIILIPLDKFRQKAVSETITCKDAVNSANQPFPTMTFTAYYENTPTFDISAGAIMSLTPGHQVGVVSSGAAAAGPLPVTMGPGICVPSTPPASCLGVTSQSKVQFMPAVFVEWHKNWKWPAVTNGRAYHPFGYVGSFGPAFGLSVNPNNGTGNAEFFEGVSLGIQRISLMAGFHNGRYQTFADGYFVGEEVPSGTTPRTERIWTTHFAIAISYRIALH